MSIMTLISKTFISKEKNKLGKKAKKLIKVRYMAIHDLNRKEHILRTTLRELKPFALQ